jgi:hypothetical protein
MVFGFDYASGPDESVTSFYQKAMDELRGDAYQQVFQMLAGPVKKSAAAESMKRAMDEADFAARQKRSAVGINKDYETPWPAPTQKRLSTYNDLDFEVIRVAARVGKTFSQVERSVKNAFGGRVRPDQVDAAINFVNNLFR